MKIKNLFWRKNIFGELRRAFLGIKCNDETWLGLKKDHALEWGEPNENPGYWLPIFNKISTQEKNENVLSLANSVNNFRIWATSNPKRADRPKVSRRIWGASSEDIIETWYLKNFILAKKIVGDYLLRKKINSGDEFKFYEIIKERLDDLYKIKNLNYPDIYSWIELNNNIFNNLTLDMKWFMEKNLKNEIDNYIKDRSFIILFNSTVNEKVFYTTIISNDEFLELDFFRKLKNIKNNGGHLSQINFKDNNIAKEFLFIEDDTMTTDLSDEEERVKIYLSIQEKKIDEQISKIAIEDRYQQDINEFEPYLDIEEGPIEKKNRKGSDLTNKYKYQRNPLISAYALKRANYKCEIDSTHETFILENSRNYVEGHHVIPMHAQEDFEYSIDVPENIVALCPNCHRKVHLSNNETKFKIINRLFNIIQKRNLLSRKITITEDKLKEYY